MDIVQKLRDAATDWNGSQLADEETPMDFLQSRDLREAADEIEMLRKELEIFRSALAYAVKEADGWHDDSHGGPIEDEEMERVRALLPPNTEVSGRPSGRSA